VVRVPVVVSEGLQGGSQIDQLSVFPHKKYILSYNFYLLDSVNNSSLFVQPASLIGF